MKKKAAKAATAPPRGEWEATLRNIRAMKKTVAALTVRVEALEGGAADTPDPSAHDGGALGEDP